MKVSRWFLAAMAALALNTQFAAPANAGLFKMDFGSSENIDEDGNPIEVQGWDVIETFVFDPDTFQVKLTDQAKSGDNDVVLDFFDMKNPPEGSEGFGMTHNNPTHEREEGLKYDGIDIPWQVKDDYLYRNPDHAGTEILFRFSNIDPGKYNVTLFEGRTTDTNGQYGKVWVDNDKNGSGEPELENTGTFVSDQPTGEPATVTVDIKAGQYLWYAHMEDCCGGISGMIIRPLGSAAKPGDFDGNGTLDAADIDALSAEVRKGTNTVKYDVTADNKVNQDDRTKWVAELKKTYFGDANLDGVFNTSDFVSVFQIGEYEDAAAGNSNWSEGDWNGDADFNSSDFVAAFQDGGFEKGPRAAVAAVPEPTSAVLFGLGLLFGIRRRK
jgi:hypothetical protein